MRSLILLALSLAAFTVTTAQRVSTSGRCGPAFGLTCQGSRFGNCCSQYSYCGSTTAHCATGCRPGYGTCRGSQQSSLRSSSAASVATRTSASTVPSPTQRVSRNGRCGRDGNGQTCLGSSFGNCCSQRSYCGSTAAYCGTSCQRGFGNCNGASPPVASSSTRSSTRSSTTPSPSATSSACTPQSTNILRNPQFASGSLSPWSLWPEDSPQNTITVSPGAGHNDNTVYTYNGVGGPGSREVIQVVQQEIPIPDGTEVTCSGWAKATTAGQVNVILIISGRQCGLFNNVKQDWQPIPLYSTINVSGESHLLQVFIEVLNGDGPSSVSVDDFGVTYFTTTCPT